MQISHKIIDGIVVVKIDGRLVVGVDSIFKSEMEKISANTNKIVFDCSAMEYLDSTGLGVLVRFYKEFTSRGGKLVIAELQDKAKLVFEVTRVHRVFNIFDTLNQAIDSMR